MNTKNLFKNLDLSKLGNYSGAKVFFVTGMVTHLQRYFVDYLVEELGFNFVYSKRNNSDIQKYFSTLDFVSGKEMYSIAGMEHSLEENSFVRVKKVTSKGEWARVGDMLSFWPIEYRHPIRISYFGDDVEYLETYDEVYGTKIKRINEFVFGNLGKLEDKVDWYEIGMSGSGNINRLFQMIFSQYDLPRDKDKEVISFDYNFPTLFYKRFDLLEKELDRLDNLGWKIIINTRHEGELSENLKKYSSSLRRLGSIAMSYETIDSRLHGNDINKENGRTKRMSSRKLGSVSDEGGNTEAYYPGSSYTGKETIDSRLRGNDKIDDIDYIQDLPAGFSSESNRILYLTDRELFGTIFLQKERKQLTTKQAQKILEKLEGEIEIGDYVVHEDHGVGVYEGLQQDIVIEERIVNFDRIRTEKLNDFLMISYAEGDELLIPISQIQKITKYIGTTEEEPTITRLHKGTWSKNLKRAKKAVELIAKDLVEHYAKLSLVKIKPYEFEDSEFYKDFVKSFPYEETPDQLNAIEDIKKDLAQEKPMNRLIVGDVGFGKTEVSMRAAFRVAETGKQVAVLCPTTVLAAQHFKVFKDRFEEFGIEVNYVSRFNTSAENKKIIEKAKEGKVNILVGTHRLLSNDVEFKDLGLVIIDEEQKFGVKQKEKIRQLQYGAHSIMMSATPIPRTLSMAMSQIQEVSIIATPPTQRRAVHTEVQKIEWNKIAQQLLFEIKRGGQAYFVHNRVETIESIKNKLQELLPDIRFAVGHGQMTGRKLDTVISDFYEEKSDVLVCTTIIENGIDMPNVNTIIINGAQNFGLGQLYQLRGRVGRSDKQAYCYLYYKGTELKPEENNSSSLRRQGSSVTSDPTVDSRLHGNDTEKAAKKEKGKSKQPPKYVERLKAIMESQELGSGFKLASRDLEIRGAGNMLGKQQHGNISNVGLALYMQMLAEEIERVRNLESE